MTKAILSVKNPQYAQRLDALGYDILPSEEIPCKMPYERDHADLQCLILNDTAFILNRCQRLIKALSDDYHVIECGARFAPEYPDNVPLSALLLRNKLIGRTQSIDDRIMEYAKAKGYEPINVNQGYAKCACAVVSDRALITADSGVCGSLRDTGIDLLKIGEGNILLDDADHGFIGGASGYDKDRKTLYLCGGINKHPDGERIQAFCEKHDTEIVCLTDDALTDIGGIIFC